MPRQITIDIVGDAKKFTKTTDDAVKGATSSLGKLDGVLKKVSGSGGIGGAILGGVGLGAGLGVFNAVTGAIGGVVDMMGDATKAFREDQVSQAQLKTALEANVTAWDGNTDAIEKVIGARTDLGFSDDEQRASMALLVASTKNVNDALEIERTAMDLARLKSISLADASSVLVRAYNGSVTGLKKMGIEVKAGTKGLAAIAEVQKRAAGQAVAFGETSAGAAERSAIKIDEMKESFGALTSKISDVAQQLAGQVAGSLISAIDAVGSAWQGLQDILHPEQVHMRELSAEVMRLTTLFHLNGPAVLEFLGNQQKAARIAEEDAQFQADLAAEIANQTYLMQKAGATQEDIDSTIRGLTDAWTAQREAVKESIPVVTQSNKTWQEAWDAIEAARHAGIRINGVIPKITDNLGDIPPAAHAAGNAIGHGLVNAIDKLFQTSKDVLDPLRQQWKHIVDAIKHPFRPENLANEIRRWSKQAAREARDAANPAGTRQRWAAVGRAMSSPIFQAMVNITGDVERAIGVINMLNQFPIIGRHPATRTPKKHPHRRHRASGGPVAAGQSYEVGESGRETLTMFPGGGGMVTPMTGGGGGGNSYTITVNVAPGGDLVATGKAIVEAIRQFERRSGKAWRAA